VGDEVTTEQALACVAAIFPTTTIEGAGLVDLPAVSRTHFEAVLGLNNAPYPWRSERDRLAEQAETLRDFEGSAARAFGLKQLAIKFEEAS
jgi:adenylosuccinate lyase